VCGNGGSAANAQHWATDFLYPVTKAGHHPLRITALTANAGVLTCLANDIGYDEVFSRQLAALARPGDLLIVLSGSGNSPNVLRALEIAGTIDVRSFAILGFSGGRALQLADDCLHVAVDDMQLAEDVQLVAGHMVMRLLLARSPAKS
jgi:D-sedoheptulose 7-phosphate isomerase